MIASFVINLFIPEAAANSKLSTNWPQRWFVENLSQTKAEQQSVAKLIAIFAINLFIPEATANSKLLINKLASEKGLLKI